MKVFCSGFNLYGQFIKCPNSVVEGFIDCPYDEVTNLELSQTFSLAFKEDTFFLHGAKDGKTHQIQKVQIPDALKITQTACTENRILFLTDNGMLFKLDLNKSNTVSPLPLNILNNDRDQFTKIACGSKINVALSRRGHLFNLPDKLDFKHRNIVDIRAGREHCIILDVTGNIYSFGRGSRGQLGHGNLEDELKPELVQALAGIKISKIAAGGWHSCALSAEGDLYTWGWNSNGQLGFGKPEKAVSVMASPQVVDFEDLDTNVTDVACGNRHTIALLDSGKLFGAGWNKYHQLGSVAEQSENIYSMTLLFDFSSFSVNKLKCGPWSSAVIVD